MSLLSARQAGDPPGAGSEESTAAPGVRLLLALALLSTLHFAAGQAADAKPPATTAKRPTREAGNEAEKRLFAIYAEDAVGRQVALGKAPGALLAVVADGEIQLLKGFGWADREARRAVDPGRTVFHLGSIAKALTATAVLQLFDAGRLDLHEDIGPYFSWLRTETEIRQPITAHHLLTHTGGFDGLSIGRKTLTAPSEPLAEYLRRRMPPAIRPPGLVSVDSDHGYSLAGLLVEKISSKPFDLYLQDRLFRPLGMRHSSFTVTPTMQGDLARGYRGRGRDWQLVPVEHIRTRPASMLLSTGADMARWMIALLEGGVYSGRRILQPDSARRQLSRQFSNHPLLPGRSYGLSEGGHFDPPAFHLDGSASGMTSALVLLPAQRIGMLVAFNSQTDVWEALHRLLGRFAEEWPSPEARTAPGGATPSPARLAGYYRDAAVSETTAERFFTLLEQERLAAATAGLVWHGETYLPIAPLAFHLASGSARLGFLRQDGRVRFLSVAGAVRVKLRWIETRPIQLGLWLLFTTAFLPVARGWAGAQIPRPRPQLEPNDTLGPRWPLRLTQAAALLNLAFIVGLFGGLIWLFGRPQALDYGAPAPLHVLLALPLAAGALTTGAACGLPAAWRKQYWTRAARRRFTLTVLLLLVFLPFLWRWNLLGFQL